MEDRNKPVMGYPPQFFQGQYGIQLSGQPRAEPNHPTTTTATTTTSNTRTACPFAVQAPPTNDNPRPSHVPPCDALGWFVMAIVTAVMIGYMIWVEIHFQPYPPQFRLDSVSVSPFNVSNSHITANWSFSLYVRNPNSFSLIFYEQVKASVFYKKVSLSSTAITPFYQYEDDERSLKVSMTASSVSMNNSVANAIVVDRSHGAVNFTMTINGIVRFNSPSRGGRKRKMRVSCEDVKVGVSSNTTAGTMLGESRKCKVHCK